MPIKEPLGKTWARKVFLSTNDLGYRLARPLIFRQTAQDAHESMMHWLRRADRVALFQSMLELMRDLALHTTPVRVGGLTLDSPLMLAAGLVKGDGFETEDDAYTAVERGENIIPGWRSMPRLVGLVEFGSFTRWPRLGNPGTVVWRDVPAFSTQNRVGLRNPGAGAAAAFLARHKSDLPQQFGINIAVSPGVDDPAQQTKEVLAALALFVDAGVRPTWFTLNLSCPNTGDDPQGNQSADLARELCGAAVAYLDGIDAGPRISLWVKVSPGLSDAQYRALLAAFEDTGVEAVIATNTTSASVPHDATLTAGVGGGRLHSHAVQAASILLEEKVLRTSPVDVIGCGGVIDGQSYRDFAELGTAAVQYWSALVFRGPLAAALIADEVF